MASYRLRDFLCKAEHLTRSWQWGDVERIKCDEKSCRRLAYRALPARSRNAQNSEPFAYYQHPKTGKLFIAATHADTRAPRGYVRREVRTFRDRDRFYKEQRERGSREQDQLMVAEANFRDWMTREQRDSLKAQMASMSEEGRDLAREAMRRSDARANGRREFDAYIQGFEFDRSNRESNNDESTGWHRRD